MPNNFAVFNSAPPPWSIGNNLGVHPPGNGYMPGYTTPVNWWVHNEPGGWHDSYVGTPLPPPMLASESPILVEQFNNSILLTLMTAESLGVTGTLGSPAANPGPYDPSAMPQTGSIHGTGPYVQEFSLTPPQAEMLYVQDASLAEQLYDLIVNGVGQGASSVAPLGTPGQLMPFTDPANPAYEYQFGANMQSDGSLQYPGTYGGKAPGSYTTGINPKFLNVKPKKRKQKKAWWLNPTGQ